MPAEAALRFNATMLLADSPGTTSTNVDVNQANPFAWTAQHSWAAIATPSAPAAGIAQLFAQTNNGHTDFWFQDNDAIPYNVGRDLILRVRNQTGVTINKGQVVYINGSNGTVPTVALAKADSTMANLPAYGVATANISNNAFGHVMTRGVLTGIDTSAFAAGNLLYVSATTAGALTNVAPTHPAVEQQVGVVAVAGVGNGAIALTTVPINLHRIDGTNQATFAIGDATGTTKSLLMKNAAGTSLLSWNPTAARTLTLPDATATLAIQNAATPGSYTNASVTVAADGSISAVSSGAGGTTDVYPYPLKSYVDNRALNKVLAAANQTSGTQFVIYNKTATITGARFFWGAYATTVRVKLWATGNGTALKSIDVVTTNTPGWYTATFTTPQTSTPWQPYYISFWDTALSQYTIFNMFGSGDLWSGTNAPNPILTGPYFAWMNWASWANGDAQPTGTATSERYPIEPVFTIP